MALDFGNVRLENLGSTWRQFSGSKDSRTEVALSKQVAIMPDTQQHRALRMIVWGSRAVGWILIAFATLNLPQIQLAGSLRVLMSVALGVLGVAWVVGVELFLRFFDRYLSRN